MGLKDYIKEGIREIDEDGKRVPPEPKIKKPPSRRPTSGQPTKPLENG